jgi:hypothetical protein
LEVNGKNRKPLIVVLCVNILDGRHLDPAGRAPCCPDIDQDNPSFEVTQLDGRSFQIGQSKILIA